MMQPRRSTATMPSRSHHHIRRFFFGLLLLAVVGNIPPALATITVVDTGHKYASRQDLHLEDETQSYQRLWKGYEYKARLQYVDGNLPLCPDANDPNRQYSLTVPRDGQGVALLVRQEGGCSLEEKIHFALNNIQPAHLVQFLIIDGYKRTTTWPNGVTEEEEGGNRTDSKEEYDYYDDDLMQDWIRKHEGQEQDDDKKDVIPLYLLHVSYHTEYELLDVLLHQTDESKAAGGPHLLMDSRLGTGNLSPTALLWIALSALLSACACSCLMMTLFGQDTFWLDQDENEAQQPTRPVRRRLTREQVQRLLPKFQWDGQALHYVPPRHGHQHQQQQHQPSSEQALDGNGNIRETAASVGSDHTPRVTTPVPPAVETLDLECCSICLDEYEPGDRLRCLSCNHVFHSQCIGRWLVERSATCPLCKTDLYEEEEESDDESEEASIVDDVTPTDAAAAEATPAARRSDVAEESWWDRMYRLASERRSHVEGVDTQPLLEQQQSPLPTTAPSTVADQRQGTTAANPSRSSSSGQSFWRRMMGGSSSRSSQRSQEMRQPPGTLEVTPAQALAQPLLSSVDEEAPPPRTTDADVELQQQTPAATPEESSAQAAETPTEAEAPANGDQAP